LILHIGHGGKDIMMKNHKASTIAALLFFAGTGLAASSPRSAQEPLTTAEASLYKSTSLYKDVMTFIGALQQQSPLIHVEFLCRSAEGRDVPLMILADPPVSSPQDLNRDGRAVVYIQANIHAGEVEGKEASLMLARDILLHKKPAVLDKLVVLIAPVFNADGNEKIKKTNRPQQDGPENGVGVRPNGLNQDLNRDAMKLESPELQGVVQNVLGRWDPVLAMDLHTTNGFYHEEPVTFAWAPIPNGDPAIRAFMRDKLQVAVEARMRDVHKVQAIMYGEPKDFRSFEKGFEAFGAEPHFFTNYVGLRNRLSILNENYNHADFKTRVLGCNALLESVLTFTRDNKDTILKLTADADRAAIARGLKPTDKDRFGLTFEPKPIERKLTINIWEMEVTPREGGYPEIKKTDRKKTMVLPFFADYEATRSVQFPSGYLITVPDSDVIDKLRQHGLIVERLTEPITAEIEAFLPKELKAAERPFQGHWVDSVKGDYKTVSKEFAAGVYFVSTAQPLGGVAAALLEPESNGGLLSWNYFDRYLAPQWSRGFGEYPVYRLLKPMDLIKEIVR
jgi:hypothetical protein